MTADPVLDTSDSQALNAYSYGNNSLVSFSDPTGMVLQIDGRPAYVGSAAMSTMSPAAWDRAYSYNVGVARNWLNAVTHKTRSTYPAFVGRENHLMSPAQRRSKWETQFANWSLQPADRRPPDYDQFAAARSVTSSLMFAPVIRRHPVSKRPSTWWDSSFRYLRVPGWRASAARLSSERLLESKARSGPVAPSQPVPARVRVRWGTTAVLSSRRRSPRKQSAVTARQRRALERTASLATRRCSWPMEPASRSPRSRSATRSGTPNRTIASSSTTWSLRCTSPRTTTTSSTSRLGRRLGRALSPRPRTTASGMRRPAHGLTPRILGLETIFQRPAEVKSRFNLCAAMLQSIEPTTSPSKIFTLTM